MNKQEFAKIVQAWAEGETIQWASCDTLGEYGSLPECDAPSWRNVQFHAVHYRIKPKEITTMRFAYASPIYFDSSNMQHAGHNLKLLFTDNVLTKAEVIK